MAGGPDDSTKHIVQSLIVNLAIAVAKGIAAFITGSGAMLAETIHSFADCGNQGLLLFGVKRSRKAPDASHPLGYGRALYFWSFMVALLLFSGGGMFSMYEGIHKIAHPEPIESVLIAVVILAFSLALEGYATLSNIREANKRRKGRPFFQYLRSTKDSDFVVVMGENSAASIGLIFALIAVGLAHVTGDPRWDAAGSLAIGIVLIGVAVFLAIEVKSLLVGEAADPEIEAAAKKLLEETGFGTLLWLVTIQQGPGEVVVSIKIRPRAEQTAIDLCENINRFEAELRARVPEAKWIFVEPDLTHAD